MTCLLKLFISGDYSLLQEHAIILIELVKFCSVLCGLVMEKSQNSICQHCSQFPANKIRQYNWKKKTVYRSGEYHDYGFVGYDTM